MGIKVHINIATKTDLHEIIPLLKRYSANIIELNKSYIKPEFEEIQKYYMMYIDFPDVKSKDNFIRRIRKNKNMRII